MKFKIESLDERTSESWDRCCLESDDAWFWHTAGWLDYCQSYGMDSCATRNLSFSGSDDTGVIAVCPLLIERRYGGDNAPYYEFSCSGSGGPGIVPAIRNDVGPDRREKVLREIFETVDSIARSHNVVRARFRMTPLGARGDEYNWLQRYGCLDCSGHTQIIDLKTPAEDLWSSVRKGHKYDIHRGEKFYTIHVYDQWQPDREAFDQYRILHHKASGRITRPMKTFDLMYDWIKTGNGMLCGVSREGRFVGFSYVLLYKGRAYYASASDDPEFETAIPISHVIQWKVINWLRENGYATYEIGVQQYGPQLNDIPSSKDMSISFFKRGFGGRTVPLFRGDKYYNMSFMKSVLQRNIESLVITMKG